ncbi:MAG: hypothetical protein ACKO01_09480 [Erythrobacter sp.]
MDVTDAIDAALFMDTGAGVLVDKVADWEQPERYVFSGGARATDGLGATAEGWREMTVTTQTPG